jgi:hypothetical protein
MSQSKHVFQDACVELAAILKRNGFEYFARRRQAYRQGGLFEHIVIFNSSRSINSIPGNIHLEIKAMARSDKLGQYRQTRGITLATNENYLFDTIIENIFRPAPPYIRYDIGDPSTRQAVIQGIQQVLAVDVINAFDTMESPLSFAAAVKSQLFHCLSEAAIRDYLGCFHPQP